MEESIGKGQNRKPRSKTRNLAMTGILSAFVVIVLAAESLVPTGRLGFYVLAAFILCAILMETDIKWAWAAFAATSAAALLVVPEKLNVLPYIIFFGIYTLLKFHIESLRRPWLEIVLKLAAFNLILWPAWSITKTFLPPSLTQGTMVILAGVILQIAFALYDILFTAWIRYYLERIAPRVRKD